MNLHYICYLRKWRPSLKPLRKFVMYLLQNTRNRKMNLHLKNSQMNLQIRNRKMNLQIRNRIQLKSLKVCL